MPPAFWRENFAYIGTNRCLAFAGLQGFAWDALVIRDGYRDLWLDNLVGWTYHKKLWIPSPAWKVGPASKRVTHCDEFVRQVGEWQHERVVDHNREAAVVKNISVAIMAANWAWIQGARELYLVGVDYCGPHARMIEPYTVDTGNTWRYEAVPDCIEKHFRRMVKAAESHGGKIVNLSPDTRLKAVPTADWKATL